MSHPSGIKLGFSHLREHKFRQDTLNPICNYGDNIETTTHYLLVIYSKTSCQGQESFTNAFSSNLKIVNLKFLSIKKLYTLEDKALISQQNGGNIHY